MNIKCGDVAGEVVP